MTLTTPQNRIPYGISSFEVLRTENYLLVDKTPFIAQFEFLSEKYPFFLRPRRFGKSLFCSMIEFYYDARHADKFDNLFQNTWIHQNPTPLKLSYLVLRFSFDQVKSNGTMEDVQKSFREHIIRRIEDFLSVPPPQNPWSPQEAKKVFRSGDETSTLGDLESLCKHLGHKLFVVIDEYDNFANNILADFGEQSYKDLTHGTGFFRVFWTYLKSLTAEKTLNRLFVTGVSPLVLADVTSGFNIGKNVTHEPCLAEALGFTENETRSLIEKCTSQEFVNQHFQIMKTWYNGYGFAEDGSSTTVFNSDMVLYYLSSLQRNQKPPSELLDINVRTDFKKIQRLVLPEQKLNGNFNILTEILNKGTTEGTLVESFAIGDKITGNKFKSFLCYMGLTTLLPQSAPGHTFWAPPNKVIENMMWGYIRDALALVDDVPHVNIDTFDTLLRNMATQGSWQPALGYLFEQFYNVASNRDFVHRELGIKCYLLAYLHLSSLWITTSEHELKQGYADIVLTVNPIAKTAKHNYIIELKYLTQTAKETRANLKKRVKTAVEEATAQLQRYTFPKGAVLPEHKVTKIIAVAGSQGLLYLNEIEDIFL